VHEVQRDLLEARHPLGVGAGEAAALEGHLRGVDAEEAAPQGP